MTTSSCFVGEVDTVLRVLADADARVLTAVADAPVDVAAPSRAGVDADADAVVELEMVAMEDVYLFLISEW
jgi:hypothetical protein